MSFNKGTAAYALGSYGGPGRTEDLIKRFSHARFARVHRAIREKLGGMNVRSKYPQGGYPDDSASGLVGSRNE